MLLPKNMSKTKCMIIYPIVCALHGLLFGALWAPANALMYSLNFEQTIAWVVAGLPFDAIHGLGNFVFGFLIYPLSKLISKLQKENETKTSIRN